jgi:nucleotide-binding universal stress UspA family protein
MAMLKDILVSVDASEIGRERLRFAVKIAKAHGADLVAYYTSPTTAESANVDAEEIAETIAADFQAQLDQHQLKGAWLLSGTPVGAHITARIRCTDLAILGLGDPDRILPDHQGFSIGEIVQSCGRPILGIPIGSLPDSFVTTALVAWDASREASRALHDAIPLLLTAATVKIASIGPQGNDTALAEQAATHLARHGVNASVDSSLGHYEDVGSELLDRTANLGADLVVAGAYSHSRLGERLLGGTSRTLLHQMLVPVLLSH